MGGIWGKIEIGYSVGTMKSSGLEISNVGLVLFTRNDLTVVKQRLIGTLYI